MIRSKLLGEFFSHKNIRFFIHIIHTYWIILSLIEGPDQGSCAGNIKLDVLDTIGSQETVFIEGEPMEVDSFAPLEERIINKEQIVSIQFSVLKYSFDI